MMTMLDVIAVFSTGFWKNISREGKDWLFLWRGKADFFNRWEGNSGWTESPLCLVDAPLGSHHALVALIEEYLELNVNKCPLWRDFAYFLIRQSLQIISMI